MLSSGGSTYICRSSHSPSPATAMKRLHCSIACSFESASSNAKPAISSLDSANGPSVTLIFFPVFRTRAPNVLGKHPSVAMSSPDLVISSMSWPIRSIISGVGGTLVSTAFQIDKNRMTALLSWLYQDVERDGSESTKGLRAEGCG